jgi:hypothetical protein
MISSAFELTLRLSGELNIDVELTKIVELKAYHEANISVELRLAHDKSDI